MILSSCLQTHQTRVRYQGVDNEGYENIHHYMSYIYINVAYFNIFYEKFNTIPLEID